MGDTEKTQKVGFFKGIKQEFKKVTWLDKKSVFKQSVAVVGISVAVGAIIVLMDTVIQFGLKYLTM